ncbi:MAG: AbrB/MazE/SpoVT family DNA-binding domain-containing protein [Cytophagales bacterium]|nr:AbrB/MazE/SpoVT family DNA-binding domain-containing protein [Cytophagales bacterium]
MKQIIVKSGILNLPKKIADKLNGKKVEFYETKEGILVKPVEDIITKARGILKGTAITSESFCKLKEKEKELER